MKDTRGCWWGDYWGAISIGYNGNLISNPPKTWKDLLKPEYKGKVAMNGSPLSSNSAVSGVIAAAIANGGSTSNVGPGIDFFATLKKSGQLHPGRGRHQQTVASGQTPISIDWDYNNLAYTKEFPAAKWGVAIPSDGVYGGYYAQAINATAPHPWAARLWQEFMFSDQGQIIFLKGFTHPARFNDLAKRKKLPASLLTALPAPALYAKAKFASIAAADDGEGDDRDGLAGEGRVVGHSSRSSTDRGTPAGHQVRPETPQLGVARDAPVLRVHVLFLFLPAGSVLHRRVQERDGRLHARRTSALLFDHPYIDAYKTSIEVSLVTARARRRSSGSRSRTPRSATEHPSGSGRGITTFSGVAANFGGIPLAFAFIATLGPLGIVTHVPEERSCTSTSAPTGSACSARPASEIVYMYFQLPLDDPRDLAGDRRR